MHLTGCVTSIHIKKLPERFARAARSSINFEPLVEVA